MSFLNMKNSVVLPVRKIILWKADLIGLNLIGGINMGAEIKCPSCGSINVEVTAVGQGKDGIEVIEYRCIDCDEYDYRVD